MTTVAYDGEIIAVDSRTCSGPTIISDESNKIIKRNGIIFVTCGIAGDSEELIKAYFGEDYRKNADASAIVHDKDKIFAASVNDKDGFWKYDTTGTPYTMGSGGDHALTAIDLGCDAQQAIKYAMKRDIYTGGRIKTHRVK